MQTVSQIINNRNRRRSLENRNPWLKIGLGFSIFLCLIGVGTSLALLWIYTNLTRDLPSIEVLPALLEPPNGVLLQATRLYDRNKEHVLLSLESPAAENKQYLYVTTSDQDGKAQFSQELIDATVAVMDPGFWKHGGYSTAGWSAGEHPTLAQRLISDLVLNSEPPSIQRNIRERLLAAQVTARYGREKVLEWYLNSIQFGDLIYGADAAARTYFGKSASELNLAEAAMLTAISQTPGTNPIIVSDYLKQQQEHVIISMLAHGLISPEEAQQATQGELSFLPRAEALQIAPAFTELVLNQVSMMIPLEQLRRGGYEIITSLDYDLQEQAACTVENLLQRLSGDEVDSSGDEDCEAAQLLPTLQSIDGSQIQDVEAEVVVIDPKSGQILAFVTTSDTFNDDFST
jgi:membrane peptidoglycan carboxypeptidase